MGKEKQMFRLTLRQHMKDEVIGLTVKTLPHQVQMKKELKSC
jgi:hypothetical protein